MLAVAQARLVIDAIKRRYPELSVELITMKTSGDLNMEPFAAAGDKFGVKGLFTKELEEALSDGELDFAVHSLKDMPLIDNEKLPIVAVSERADARDALVLPKEDRTRPERAVGCSSARRRLQLKALWPESEIYPVRGNVITRLSELEAGEYSALVLAAAGLCRAGLKNRITLFFDVREIVLAAGQGILACQGRAGGYYGYLDAVRSAEAEICAAAERSFAAALGGGCTSPVAAYAELRGGLVRLLGFYADEERRICCRGEIEGAAADAAKLGKELAYRLARGESSCQA